jgi:T5SS/PEP-CTERM-associated repeat protein
MPHSQKITGDYIGRTGDIPVAYDRLAPSGGWSVAKFLGLIVPLVFAPAAAWAVTCQSCTSPYVASGDVQTGGPTGATTVGNTSDGTLTINLGQTYNTLSLTAGVQQGVTGTVNNFGTLNDDAIIGDAGNGIFNNTGVHNVSGNLILGNQGSGTGSYSITGDTAQTNVNFVVGGNGAGNANGALIVGNGGTGTFTQGMADLSDTNSQVNVAGDLVLGQQPNAVGTYTLNTGTLNVGGQLAVGGQSTGTNSFIQNGGVLNLTNTASSNPDYVSVGVAPGSWGGALAVGGGIGNGDGSNSGGNGTYTLNAGAINTYNLLVGPSGTGTMNQYGGAVTTTFFTAGFSGNGTYNLAGGTLNSTGETVGYAGTGAFNQSGGTNTVTGVLEVGLQYASNSPGTGSYTLTGGTLSTGNTVVGDGEVGTFSNTNATHTVSGNLIVGEQNANGIGTYSIVGDTAQTNVTFVSGGNGSGNPNGALIVGNAGTGSFTQGSLTDAPTVTVAGDLALGLQSGSTGTYTLNSGTLQVDGVVIVGAASTNNNVFTQNGGIFTLTGNANGNSDYASVSPGAVPNTYPGVLYVGGESVFDSGTGTYNMNGGTLNAGNVTVGFSGTGTFNHSGGTVNTGHVDLGGCGGCNGGDSAGFYNLTGTGILNNTGDESVGDFGHGEFLQDGVATQNNVTGTLFIGNGPTGTPNIANPGNYDRSGTYTLNNGALSTQYTVVGSQGTGTFIQNGGTHAVTNTLTIGQQNSLPLSGPAGTGTQSNPIFGGPAPGVYTMTGGILTAGGDPSTGVSTSNAGIIVGDAGNGTFNQIGGSVTSGVGGGQRGDVLIGAQAGSTGVYTVGDATNQGPSLQVYGDTVVGRDAAGVSSAINPDTGQPYTLAAANGTFNVAGDGTVVKINQTSGFDSHNGGNLVIGLNGVAQGSQADASQVYMDHNLVVGANAGSSGSFTLNAKSLDGGTNLTIGSDLNVGGMTTDSYGLNLQTTSAGGTGTFNLQSGDLVTYGGVNVGSNDGNGTLNISGGTLTSGTGMNVGVNLDGLGGSGGGSGTVIQTGGTVTLGSGDSTVSLDVGRTSIFTDTTTGSYSITGAGSSLTVNGNADIGVSTGGTGSLTIGNGDDAPTVTINQTSQGDDGNLTVGDAGNGTLTIKSGSLTVQNTTQVGVNGTGIVNQSGGTFATNFLDLSQPAGSGTSTYAMTGGTLNVNADLNVGGGGASATFTQNGAGSVVNVYGTAYINGGGIYNLMAGTLNGDMIVGDVSTGTFNNSGGTHNVTGNLILGNQATGNGTYNLTGGAATGVGDFTTVGNAGQGTFLNDASTHTTQNLVIAEQAASTGTYTLQNGGRLNVGTPDFLGFADIGEHGTGTFTQNDATSSTTIYGSLDVGRYVGGTGTVNLNAGSMTVNGFAVVGDSGTGTFNQSGTSSMSVNGGGLTIGRGESNESPNPISGTGTYNLAGTATLNVTGGIDVGVQAGNTGTMNQTGGSVTSDGVTIGDAGTGKWYQSSGSNTVNGNLNVGASGVGTYTIGADQDGNPGSGATLTVNGSGLSGGNLFVGATGTGTVTASNGSLTTIQGGTSLGGPSPGETTGVGTLTVTGSGTKWTNQGQVVVGGAGEGYLNVLAGGDLESQFVSAGTGTSSVVGAAAGSSGQATVDGAGSQWNNTGALRIGSSGTGTLFISNGGGVTDVAGTDGAAASVGWQSGSNGQVTLSGGSWTNSGNLVIGDAGVGQVGQSGGTLTVGSNTASANLVLGNRTGGSGTLTVNGSSATTTVWGNATIGNSGYGSLAVDAGSVDIKGSMTIANTAAGGGAAIEGGSLTIGDGSTGQQLLITANGSMKIEDTAGAGASVTVDGTLINNGQLGLGLHTGQTPSSTLTVTQGLTNNGGFNFAGNSVLNADVTNNSYFTAQNGSGSNVTLNGNMSNNATVNVSELGLTQPTFVQNGTFTNNTAGTFQVTDGAVTINGGRGHSLDNSGTVTFANDPNGGTTPSYAPSVVALNGNVTNAQNATVNVQGSNVTITGNGNSDPALSNNGSVNVGTGANSQGSSVIVYGNVSNTSTGAIGVTNSAITVNGATTNNGTVTVTGSTAKWNGTFTNNGAYISDPSVSTFTNLNNSSTGYLDGGAGDVFKVTGNFISTSTKNLQWSTAGATLEFATGTSTAHTMDLTGLDNGALLSGFANNFAWGVLTLDAGNSLTLGGTIGTNALYVSMLNGLIFSGSDITNIIGDGLNIYYDASDDLALNDAVYALVGGGYLCPTGAASCSVSVQVNTPEPGSLPLLVVGLVGLVGGGMWRRRSGMRRPAIGGC